MGWEGKKEGGKVRREGGVGGKKGGRKGGERESEEGGKVERGKVRREGDEELER